MPLNAAQCWCTRDQRYVGRSDPDGRSIQHYGDLHPLPSETRYALVVEYDVDGKEGHPGGYAFVFSVGRVTQELDMTVACVELSSYSV